MDPNNRRAGEYGDDVGHDNVAGGDTPHPGPSWDPLTLDFDQPAATPARTVELVAGDFLVTVNPVDGSEIEPCPPAARPGRPARFPMELRADAACAASAARPAPPPGPMLPELPFLERGEELERLVRLLAQGRSVRVVGPRGAGRTTLLDLVAGGCGDLAPDGVIRLSGFRRTGPDLLHDLFHAVHDAPRHRPGPGELRELVAGIGAVVVVDDLEFGGAALDELLDATPECAFLFAATPDTPAPSADSLVQDLQLEGLSRGSGLELLQRAAGRRLTEEEQNWAGDLWFESEGLPLRFVQAGGLLRQLDRVRAAAVAVDEAGVFQEVPVILQDGSADTPAGTRSDGCCEQGGDCHCADGTGTALPSLAEAAAPGARLASRLTPGAREALRFAFVLGGEVPSAAHLPALVGDDQADTVVAELLGYGLVTPVGARYRIAAGVREQLETVGFVDDAEARVFTAARHYAWWAGHPSVTPERVSAEADVVLAVLAALSAPLQLPARTQLPSPGAARPAGEEPSSGAADGDDGPLVLRLARTAAPAFATGLHWSAWERVLRVGAEASRHSGEVAEQAYFHHELGILALCSGQLDRARAELDASIALRGAVSDRRGTVAGRRALVLIGDLSGDVVSGGSGFAPGDAAAGTGRETPGSAARSGGSGGPESLTVPQAAYREGKGGVTGAAAGVGAGAGTRGTRGGGAVRSLVGGARHNLVAVGAGALLVAVLGTVVTLGATSDGGDTPADRGAVTPSAGIGSGDDGWGSGPAAEDDAGNAGDAAEAGPTGGTGDATNPPSASASDGTDSLSSASPGGGTDDRTPSALPSHPRTGDDTTTRPGGSDGSTTRPPDDGTGSPSSTTSAPPSTPATPPTSTESATPTSPTQNTTGGNENPDTVTTDTTALSPDRPASGSDTTQTASASTAGTPGTTDPSGVA